MDDLHFPIAKSITIALARTACRLRFPPRFVVCQARISEFVGDSGQIGPRAVAIRWNVPLLGGLPDGQSPHSCGPPTRQKRGWINIEEVRKLDHLVFGELAIAVQDIRDG